MISCSAYDASSSVSSFLSSSFSLRPDWPFHPTLLFTTERVREREKTMLRRCDTRVAKVRMLFLSLRALDALIVLAGYKMRAEMISQFGQKINRRQFSMISSCHRVIDIVVWKFHGAVLG